LFFVFRPIYSSSYSIEADLLYWKANEGGLSYAFVARHADLGDEAVVKNPAFEWDFGFKLGLGYLLPRDRWDLSLRLTHFHTHTDALLHAKKDQVLYPIWITEPTPQVADQIKMHWRLHLGFVDALVGKKIQSPSITFYPQWGLRYAIARQKFNLEYQGGMFLPGREDIVRMKNKFAGIGPYGVLGIQYPLSACLSLCASGGVSAVYGQFYVHEDEDLATGHVKLLDLRDTFNRLAFIADGSIFLRWQRIWNRAKRQLHMQMGWDAVLLFKQNRLIRFFESTPIDNPGNLGLQGWQWGIEYFF
jgi:hypothetical protein